jgi:hypothetical protein
VAMLRAAGIEAEAMADPLRGRDMAHVACHCPARPDETSEARATSRNASLSLVRPLHRESAAPSRVEMKAVLLAAALFGCVAWGDTPRRRRRRPRPVPSANAPTTPTPPKSRAELNRSCRV